VRELVFSECAIAELSRKLSMPPLKIWRRIQKLVEAKIVESQGSRMRNTREEGLSREGHQLRPRTVSRPKTNNERLGKAFKTFLEVQRELMNRLSAFSDIPKGENPTDYAICASAKSFCQLFLDPDLETKAKTRARDF
jgi:DNA-binding Lrp family transcriptional regulator